MKFRSLIILSIALPLSYAPAKAADDYKQSQEYLALRDTMHRAFNNADSARFFPALQALQDYLLKQDDLHAYYTQRCNEIIFLMNQQKIYEAYVLARKLSEELRERKLDKEMYMAYNMMGHINRFCGNKDAAKQNFRHVLELMEQEGYYESMPPIYMNIVNVDNSDNPEEDWRLIDKAIEIASKYSPQRVFDIETRRTISYYNAGDMKRFEQGYKAYKEGEAQGKNSVHGRSLEVYWQAYQGNTNEAVRLARETLGDEGNDAVTKILERAGRWKEAYEALRREYNSSDSITNVVLINSMEGIGDQLTLYNMEREVSRNRIIALSTGIILLALLVAALTYIVFTRRKHLREIRQAYEHALESDRLKTAFMRNISHEVRTPLNIISGFAQVISDPELVHSTEERQHMAKMIQDNTHRITTLVDEMLELSVYEAQDDVEQNDTVDINDMVSTLMMENHVRLSPDVRLQHKSSFKDGDTIKTNQAMLRRCMSILLDNAIQHTTEGSITIETTNDEGHLHITVEDTGSGIPVEEAEHIFERFFKIDSFKEGLGLGLTLCRKLCEKLGGTVILDTSYQGPGARFVITLPL